MRLSFDLDGVITHGNHWFFDVLGAIRDVNRERAEEAEMNYYLSRQLKLQPNLFLMPNDSGWIITARKPIAQEVTRRWLGYHGIGMPVIFVDQDDVVDWSDYVSASIAVAGLKAEAIVANEIDVHFDNNSFVVENVRRMAPHTRVILVNG